MTGSGHPPPQDPLRLRLLLAFARALLRSYPRGLRAEHGPEMLDVVRHRWRSEREAGGRWVTASVSLRLVADAFRVRSAQGSRRVERTRPFRGIVFEIRSAVRHFVRRPTFTTSALIVLALGIGANTALFSVVERLILHPVSGDNGDRLAVVQRAHERLGFSVGPGGALIDVVRDRSETIESLALYLSGSSLTPGPQGLEPIVHLQISSSYLDVLGVRPVWGRAFGVEDFRVDAPSVLISDTFWESRFGSDLSILGQTLELDGERHTIVGVLPHGAIVDPDVPADIWMPLPDPTGSSGEVSGDVQAVGVLRAGATVSDASEEATRLEESFIDSADRGPWRARVASPSVWIGTDLQRAVWMMFGSVALILLIACANVANLLLADAIDRERELRTRSALGASRGVMIRGFLIHSSVLAVMGGVAGLGMAKLLLAGILRIKPADTLPGIRGFSLDWAALGFAAAVTIGVALFIGLFLGMNAARPGTGTLSPDRGRGISPSGARARNLLVIGQVAITVVLAIGATLLSRSLIEVVRVDPGFRLDDTVVYRVALPEDRYPDPAQRDAFFETMTRTLEGMPEVESVALTTAPPYSLSIRLGRPHLEGDEVADEESSQPTAVDIVTPGFFEASGIPLLRGTSFAALPELTDAVIVSRSFADRYGTERPVVGERFRFSSDPEGEWHTVVGIVENVRSHGPTSDAGRDQIYYPSTPDGDAHAHVLVRGRVPPVTLASSVRGRLQEMDSDLPLLDFTTGEEIRAQAAADDRFVAIVFGSFSVVALALAGVGLYGVVSVSVRRRRREFGIRAALGAAATQVVQAGLASSIRTVLVGIGLGTLLALWSVRFLDALLYGVATRDLSSFGVGLLLISVTATLAMATPALRAVRVDPATVMRDE